MRMHTKRGYNLWAKTEKTSKLSRISHTDIAFRISVAHTDHRFYESRSCNGAMRYASVFAM